jgi:hypothetical protein
MSPFSFNANGDAQESQKRDGLKVADACLPRQTCYHLVRIREASFVGRTSYLITERDY